MRKIIRITLCAFVVAFMFPTIGWAKELRDDKVVLGGSFVLGHGEMLNGNLLIIGGAADLQEESDVIGDVVLIGGTLQVSGKVSGSLVSIGGVIDLNERAEVQGDLVTLATVVHRSPSARVVGQVITGLHIPQPFSLPSRVQMPQVSDLGIRFSPLWNVTWFLLRTFLWSALALLVVMFMPNATQRVTRALVAQPILSGGLGLFTALVSPFLLLAIAITILLIPISLVGALVLALAWAFGRIALGLEVGRRLGTMLNQPWSLPVSAGVGTFILTLVVDGANQLIPCVGWIFPTMVGLVGFGAVLLTRFGSQLYPPESNVLNETSLMPTRVSSPPQPDEQATSQEGDERPV